MPERTFVVVGWAGVAFPPLPQPPVRRPYAKTDATVWIVAVMSQAPPGSRGPSARKGGGAEARIEPESPSDRKDAGVGRRRSLGMMESSTGCERPSGAPHAEWHGPEARREQPARPTPQAAASISPGCSAAAARA